MTISPQYSQLNPEVHIVGKEQYGSTSKASGVSLIIGLLFVVLPLIFNALITRVTSFRLLRHHPERWYAILVITVLCIALGVVILLLTGKKFSLWIEGGHYIDYRHKDKPPTIRIYYKDIVCWSAEGTNIMVFDRFGQRIPLDATLAFPHLFRYLIEHNVPVHMNSSVNTTAFLQERYRKSYAEAINFLKQDLKKS